MTSSRRRTECPDCSAENAPSSKFCDSCGASLAHIEAQPEPSRRKRDPERGEKIALERQLSRARKTLKSVRIAFGILAIPATLEAIIIGVTLSESQGTSSATDSLQFMLALASALLMVAGMLFLYVQPLFWTCLIACIYSLNITVFLIEYGWPGLGPILITLFLWSAVGMMLKIARLQKEYPDFLTNDKLKRRQRREGVEVSEARHRSEDRLRERRSAQMRSFAVVAGIVIVVIIAAVVPFGSQSSGTANTIQANTSPQLSTAEKAALEEKLTAQLEEFTQAYGEVDLDRMKTMFMPEKREYYFPRIAKVIEKRGWMQGLPTLRDEDHYRDNDHKQRIYFELPKGKLKTRWLYIEEGWRIESFTFSKTR